MDLSVFSVFGGVSVLSLIINKDLIHLLMGQECFRLKVLNTSVCTFKYLVEEDWLVATWC